MLLRYSIFVLLFVLSETALSTAFTFGTVESWTERVDLASKYIALEDEGNTDQLTKIEIAKAMHVIGFLEGIRDGLVIHEVAKLQRQYGDKWSGKTQERANAAYCIEDPYFEIVSQLQEFLVNKKYPGNMEFGVVLLEFLKEEYPCK